MSEKNAIDLNNMEQLVKAIAGFAYEKKGRNIIGIDLTGISPVTDYFVICSGSNKPQIKAICDNIEEKLAELGLRPNHIEGFRDAEWVLMDYGNIVVHIFDDENREYYNLERLWGDAPTYSFNPVDES